MTFNFSKVPNFGKVTTYPVPMAIGSGTTHLVTPGFIPGNFEN
jgi:hypothetical protein